MRGLSGLAGRIMRLEQRASAGQLPAIGSPAALRARLAALEARATEMHEQMCLARFRDPTGPTIQRLTEEMLEGHRAGGFIAEIHSLERALISPAEREAEARDRRENRYSNLSKEELDIEICAILEQAVVEERALVERLIAREAEAEGKG